MWQIDRQIDRRTPDNTYIALSICCRVQKICLKRLQNPNHVGPLDINFRPCWLLPARRYARAGNSDRNVSVRPSVCLPVCPSVTRRYCVKTKKASGMISSPSGSPKTLVFWRQISSPNSKGFPPNGGLQEGSVGKIQRFLSFKRQYLENGSRYGQSYY